MRASARRRRYGEPVERLSLRIRFGPRHTRGLGAELESIECSPLQIRSPRVHVPLPLPATNAGSKKATCLPIRPLQRTWSSLTLGTTPLNATVVSRTCA